MHTEPGGKITSPYTSYRRVAEELKGSGRRVAAPSFCIPDTVAANCRALAGTFSEVALLFFETRGCLAYTEDDLSPDLADIGLDYHVHLPLDLPWEQGVPAVWEVVRALMEKSAYLNPRCWVLHPPVTGAELEALVDFWTAAGHAPRDLLLENTEDSDLTAVADVIITRGCSLCLDLGHVLAYNQRLPLDEEMWARVRMLHVYAPGEGSRHRPLPELPSEGQRLLREFLVKAPQATVTLEVFEEQGLLDSALLLVSLMRRWGLA